MEPKVRSVVLFDVEAAVPHKVLTAATDDAIAAARASLAGVGSADATGLLGSARDGTRRVRLELTLRAAPAAALAAERAFSDAFAARLASNGFTAQRG